MKLNQYSAEQKLTLYEDLREIRNEAGRMTASYVTCDQGKIYDAYWSRREDVCLTTNDGYYVGAEAVRAYYESLAARAMLVSKLVQARFPEHLGDLSDEALFGAGELDYKSIDTYVIEVAGDRETAKGIWIIRGSGSTLTTGGPQAFWEWGWFAADYVLEDGKWKVWHLQYLQEVKRPSGQPWVGPAMTYDPLPEFEAVGQWKVAEPTIPAVVRAHYDADRVFAPSPRVPEPYEHFADTFSYGINT